MNSFTLVKVGVILSAALFLTPFNSTGQAVNSDSWAATDALGRKVRAFEDAGTKKKDKYVAIFYWTWHIYDLPKGSKVNNNTEILRACPEALKSFDHPAWSNPGRYYWEEPLFGYYKTTDPWVLRKHAELLADAGVDVVFFDCSNLTLTWKESYDVLMEVYPQNGYVPLENGGFEQTVVGVAQNTNLASGEHFCAFNEPGTYSRSFSKRKGFDPRAEGYLYGWNFQEQWDRAIEIDPELVFVTGWNEYVAGRVANWPPNKPYYMAFPDEFDWDRSRDIEPNKGWGDRGDVYYLQLIDNVRKFKGMNTSEKPSAPKTITISKADSWADVTPFYKHYKGNTLHRNHKGYSGEYYANTSGRNDIVGAKVARDPHYLYFYAETADKLTPSTGRNWMMLFLDTDRNKATGWNGYDFIINRVSPKSSKTIIEQNVGGRWEWEPVAETKFAVNNNKLVLAIKRSVLNLTGKEIDIEFKWNDNMQENGNIMDFYVNGDTAPGGRFNFVYTAK